MNKRIGVTYRDGHEGKNRLSFQRVFYTKDIKDLHHSTACDFDQFLIDDRGCGWFTEKTPSNQTTSRIFIFSAKGDLLKTHVVVGKPTLYECDGQAVIAACEGTDGKGYIYRFDKECLEPVAQWVIDGFLWDLEWVNDVLYITSYRARDGLAVLSIANRDKIKDIALGRGMFPVGVLRKPDALYIAFSFIVSGKTGKVARYDDTGCLVEETMIDSAPRQMFAYKEWLVLHGMDMTKGIADELVYVNPKDGSQKAYKIPKAIDLRAQGRHLLLYHRDGETVLYWSHEKRKIIRMMHLPPRMEAHDVKGLQEYR